MAEHTNDQQGHVEVIGDIPADYPTTDWNDPAATQDLDDPMVHDLPADYPTTDWNDPAATQDLG